MAQQLPTGDQESIGALVADIVRDGQKLVRQEMMLVRSELQTEWVKVKEASAAFVGGAILAGVGALFIAFALVHLLNTAGLPLWASFAIVAVVLVGVGAFLLVRGRTAAKDVDFVPRQAVETVKENVRWFKNQIS